MYLKIFRKRKFASSSLTACLHDQNKSGLFWRAGFFPANQSLLNTFHIALIGWIKAGSPKKPLLF